jgi:hypothetical protein
MHMNEVDPDLSREAFAQLGLSETAYVRAVRVGELIEELRSEGAEVESNLPEDATVYSVHAADGSRIAVVDEEESAFMAANDRDLTASHVH